MEIHLSAPGNKKIEDTLQGLDTSGDSSQSSASTDAQVGNKAYFSMFGLDSNSQQPSSLPEMFVDDDNATLSDVSPISDFAILPQLPRDRDNQVNNIQEGKTKNTEEQATDNHCKYSTMQKSVSFSIHNQSTKNNDKTSELTYNKNDAPRNNFAEASNDTTDQKVERSYPIIPDNNDILANDEDISRSDRTCSNSSEESMDNSKIDSLTDSSPRHVAI